MLTPNSTIEIQGKTVGNQFPTYFIADIAANHDGDLERAKDLIYMAAEAGADAAKCDSCDAQMMILYREITYLSPFMVFVCLWVKRSVQEKITAWKLFYDSFVYYSI